MSEDLLSEPLPREPADKARPRPEDGPQDVPQTPGSTVPETVGAAVGAAAGGADQVLAVARGELGQGEHPPGSNHNKYTQWYGLDGPWCDMFVSWCADRAGALAAVGRFAFTPFHAQWFKDHGRWGHVPRKGAIVFYDWGGSRDISAIDHIGIVEAVRADGSIVTIEGNTEDHVMRRVRASFIVGYGYPAYGAADRPAPTAPAWPGRFLRWPPAMTGPDVRTWQQRMHDRGWHLTVSGTYDSESVMVCRAFQAEKALEVDGIVGPLTWQAAWTAPITP
ncbi:CHAP domain-containing protein [Actinomadura sp. NTSP31]|uniref:CHAP domain-containing protein n=1 Tax=Actinomadura sp. NTSP31 TaxID=1735447 RepID=UPI0035C222F4